MSLVLKSVRRRSSSFNPTLLDGDVWQVERMQRHLLVWRLRGAGCWYLTRFVPVGSRQATTCDPKYRSIVVASWEPEFAMLAVATLCSYIVCAGFVAPLFSDLWE